MATHRDANPKTRPPLSRERVLRTAVALADEAGIGALSMRRLGHELGVEAMSLNLVRRGEALERSNPLRAAFPGAATGPFARTRLT